MIKKLKKKIFDELVKAGFNVTDSGVYEEKFPWLMLRLSNYQKANYLDHEIGIANFGIDVFSTYPGEDEIIKMEPDISDAMIRAASDESYVMGQTLKSMKILDDKGKGPISKHGVFIYQFMLAQGEENVETDGDDNGTTEGT